MLNCHENNAVHYLYNRLIYLINIVFFYSAIFVFCAPNTLEAMKSFKTRLKMSLEQLKRHKKRKMA